MYVCIHTHISTHTTYTQRNIYNMCVYIYIYVYMYIYTYVATNTYEFNITSAHKQQIKRVSGLVKAIFEYGV